jgi:hypothetical protein
MSETREALESRLSALRQQRGSAALDGRRFDSTPIRAIADELAELEDVESEKARRSRLDADRVRAVSATRLRTELAAAKEEYTAAWTDADGAVRDLVDAVRRIIDGAATMTRLAHELTGEAAPIPVNPSAVVSRLGGRLGAVLATIPGHRSRLGGLNWSGTSLYDSSKDFAGAEAALVNKHIHPILENHANGNGHSKD